MKSSSQDYYDQYQAARQLRAEFQGELLKGVFKRVNNLLKSKVPAFGPLYSPVNYKMCMVAMEKRTISS